MPPIVYRESEPLTDNESIVIPETSAFPVTTPEFSVITLAPPGIILPVITVDGATLLIVTPAPEPVELEASPTAPVPAVTLICAPDCT